MNASAARSAIVPWACVAAIVATMAASMRWQGRVWISASGKVSLWHGDVWSSECSQQVFDPYSLTHMSHGFIFAGLAWLAWRVLGGRAGWTWLGDVRWHFVMSMAAAAGWEILENSPMIIDRYRTATMSLDYLGDSVLNSLGDLLSCAIGFAIARWLGVWKTAALFVLVELVLLWCIRDNLTLNVVMLIRPIEGVREWQSALAPR